MIVALWLVKDYIVLSNEVDKIDIESHSLNLAEMAESWTCYATFLNEKKKIEMETKKELERRQKEKKIETEIEQLEWDRNKERNMHCWELHWGGEHWTWWSNEGKSNQQGKVNFLLDQNLHGCKKKDRIIRGTRRIGQQNRKEEEGLKHKLLCLLWWMTLHFFVFSFSKLNFVDLLMKLDWVLTYCSQLWDLTGPLVLLDMLCLFYLGISS